MAKRALTDREILAQLPAARKRGQADHPRAAAARYDRLHRRIQVTLTNGALLSVPVDLIASLRQAEDKDLAGVSVGVAGVGVRWEGLDEDLSIAGLARMALGGRILLQASGAAGGSVRTAAKAVAARRNGKKGGRPRKVIA
jgi:hypothetical protein